MAGCLASPSIGPELLLGLVLVFRAPQPFLWGLTPSGVTLPFGPFHPITLRGIGLKSRPLGARVIYPLLRGHIRRHWG